MKKIMMCGLVFTGVLFGNCAEAERVFADSRDETNLTIKIALIGKANKLCSPFLLQAVMEMERLKMNHLIENNHFDKTMETRLNKLMGDIEQSDDLPAEFRFNTQQQIHQMFKRLYSKQKALTGKKSLFGAVNKLDEKLELLNKKFKRDGLKSLEEIGGLYKSNLKFLKNSYEIDLDEGKELKLKVKEIIASNPKALFSVTGYASSGGSSSYNEKLAEKRAKSFVTFVGKNSKNIKTFSKGEAFLVCNDGLIAEADENNEYRCINGEDREASRRVTIGRVR